MHQVPKGIDPGWAYNPGANRNQPIVHFVDKLEVAQPELAAAAVDKLVKSDVFTQWHKKPQGEFPMGVLNTDIKEHLKATQSVVKLSEQTLTKQLKTHSELTLSEYRLLPKVIQKGRVIALGGEYLIFWQHNGRLYQAIIKATKSDELNINAFYRAKERDMKSALRVGKMVGDWW